MLAHIPLLLLSLLIAAVAGAVSARAQTVVFWEDFDGATVPNAPVGWTLGTGWETSGSVSSTGSGFNNLVHSGSQGTSATTPLVDLGAATFATLTYLARRTGSYDPANLVVTASTDGGTTFTTTVLGAGLAVPTASSSYVSITTSLPSALLGEPDVVFRFEGQGLSSSSSNARIDDVQVELYTAADAPGGTLGFARAAGSGVAESDSVAVPLTLSMSAPPGLQGLQFRVSWALDSLVLADVLRGPSVADAASWSLSHESGPGYVDVVLLGEGITSLASGTYDSLLTLQYAVGAVDSAVTETLDLSNVVSALATPDGTDGGVLPGPASFQLDIEPGVAIAFLAPTSLDIGTVWIGASDSATVTISNPGGTRELEVSNVTSTNLLFTIEPDSGVVAPDDSLEFVVTFAPVDTAFGHQEADLSFHHNGADSTTTITITGKGRGGRGDAEGDGSVDVLDIVHAIDFVLARVSPGPVQTAAADLFPFPSGDGALDVRDLTVLAQAVARGQWPDGIDLPAEVAVVGKTGAGAAHVALRTVGPNAYVLEVEHAMPVRGYQLILPAEPTAFASPVRPNGMTLRSSYDAAREELRIVAYAASGSAADPGVQQIQLSGPVGAPRFATVVGHDLNRIAVDANIPTFAEAESASESSERRPYPNPLVAGTEILHIPGSRTGAEVEIFNVLGRRVYHTASSDATVEWDGRDDSGRHVAPGLYIARSASEGEMRTWSVVVLR